MLLSALVLALGFKPVCSPLGDIGTLFTVLVKVLNRLDLIGAGAIVGAVVLEFVFKGEEFGVGAAFSGAVRSSLLDDAGNTEVGTAGTTAVENFFFGLEADGTKYRFVDFLFLEEIGPQYNRLWIH